MNDVRQTAKKDKSAFLAMCDIWGIETAIKKCEEFGIPISPPELREVQEKARQKREEIAAAIRQLRESKGRCTD